jgi:hypothetical protein
MMGKGSGKNGLRSFAPDLKVWVGGMPPNNVTESENRALADGVFRVKLDSLKRSTSRLPI